MRVTRLVPVVLAAVLAAAACSGGGAAPDAAAPAADATVDVRLVLEPTSLDITSVARAALPQLLLDNVHEGLLSRDADGEVVPRLAAGLPQVSPDGLTYTFTLRDELTFADGSPLTSADGVWSYERVIGPDSTNPAGSGLASIAEVNAPDARAAPVRRRARQGRPLRAHRRVPDDPARRLVGHPVRLPRRAPVGRGRTRRRPLRRPGDLVRRLVRRGPAGGRCARRRVPDLGHPATGRGRARRARTGNRAAARAGAAVRRPAARGHPGHRGAGVGGRRRLLADADEATIAAAQRTLAAEQSVGQRKMVALHGGRRDALEVHPNLWAGVGLLRGGAGTALVGSHAEVAARIAEYRDAGYDEFVLSGWPHDESARRFGAGVVPELRRLGLLPARAVTGRR